MWKIYNFPRNQEKTDLTPENTEKNISTQIHTN